MSEKTSVKKNMVMNALLTMSSLIFPFITFPYISRVLGPEMNGRIGFVTSVVTYFAMFAQLGIPTYGVRACAKVRNDKEKLSKIVHELLFINIVLSVFVYIIFGLSIVYIGKFNKEKSLFIVIGMTIFLNIIGVEWVYRALEKYSYITIRSILFKLIAVIAMLLLIHNKSDYVLYGGITIFASSASNILNFINLRRYVYFKYIGNYDVKQHLKPVLVFFSMSVAATIYTNLDNVMLGFMKGDTQVGYYTAAVKIKSILMSIVTSASAVLLPRASYYVEKKLMNEFYAILRKTMHFIILIAFAFSVYFMAWAKEGVFLLSGKEYEGAIIPMMIIMPTLFLIGMTNVLGIQMMVPLGREKDVLFSEIAGAIVDLILNAILIPHHGAVGAAIGTLVAELVVLIWQLNAVRDIPCKVYGEVQWGKTLIGIIIATVISIGVKLVGFSEFIALVLSASLFFGCYGIMLFVLGDKLVKEILNNILKKIKK